MAAKAGSAAGSWTLICNRDFLRRICMYGYEGNLEQVFGRTYILSFGKLQGQFRRLRAVVYLDLPTWKLVAFISKLYTIRQRLRFDDFGFEIYPFMLSNGVAII